MKSEQELREALETIELYIEAMVQELNDTGKQPAQLHSAWLDSHRLNWVLGVQDGDTKAFDEWLACIRKEHPLPGQN